MLTLQQTETLVEKLSNLYWDGWNLVVVDVKEDGYSHPRGIFFDNKWSVKRVIKPNSSGLYSVPKKYSYGK